MYSFKKYLVNLWLETSGNKCIENRKNHCSALSHSFYCPYHSLLNVTCRGTPKKRIPRLGAQSGPSGLELFGTVQWVEISGFESDRHGSKPGSTSQEPNLPKITWPHRHQFPHLPTRNIVTLASQGKIINSLSLACSRHSLMDTFIRVLWFSEGLDLHYTKHI